MFGEKSIRIGLSPSSVDQYQVLFIVRRGLQYVTWTFPLDDATEQKTGHNPSRDFTTH